MYMGAAILPVVLLIAWVNLVIYASVKARSRIALLLFGLSFFHFLLGREFLERFFGYEVETFSDKVITHTEVSLILSLVTITVFYFLFEKMKWSSLKLKKKTGENSLLTYSEEHFKSPRVLRIQKCAKILFYIAIVFSAAYHLKVGLDRSSVSYYESYMESSTATLGTRPFEYIAEKFDQFLPIYLAVFWATFPSRKKCNRASILYAVCSALSLLSGSRSKFLLGIMWIIVYYVYRWNNAPKDERWITKKMMIGGCAMVPVGIIGLSAMEGIRAGEGFRFSGILHTFVGYFYQQGVSVNVIKRSYEMAELLPPGRYYSLAGITESVVGRLLGFPHFADNSVAYATQGSNLAHALSYLLMPTDYLAGRGSGTSYIAELYHDFGYIGIVLGSVLMAFLLVKVIRLRTNSVFLNAALLLIVKQLFWSPRGGFTDFLLVLLRPFSILAFLSVWFLSVLLFRKKKAKAD